MFLLDKPEHLAKVSEIVLEMEVGTETDQDHPYVQRLMLCLVQGNTITIEG